MKQPQKSISELSDREILERIAFRTKEAADAANWTKNYIIVSSIIAVILIVIGYVSR